MIGPLLGILVVLAALGASFALAAGLRRRGRLSAEAARKLVHFGMGTTSLSFPVLFHDPAPIAGLAILASLALLAVRVIPVLRCRFGFALHGVGRRSYGEFAFVGGIAALFCITRHNVLTFEVAVAVLTVADSLAAFVGSRFGLHRFTLFGSVKSLEGSLAFFGAAFACIYLPLRIAGEADPLAVAAGVATVLTLVEAASPHGLDNLTVPLAGGLLVGSLS